MENIYNYLANAQIKRYNPNVKYLQEKILGGKP